MSKRVLISCFVSAVAAGAWLLYTPESRAHSADPLIDGYLKVEVASVADAVEQVLGVRGYMTSKMRPVYTSKFAGPAVTVLLKKEEHDEGSAAFQGALDAIDSAPAGSVYVVALEGEDADDIAALGGLMVTAMKTRGLAGAVAQGGVRDTPQVKKIQFPVFATGITPATSIGHYRFVSANEEIMCGGVKVRPGDIITADEDGVAVIPKDKAKEVLEKAEQNDQTEHEMYPYIEKFKSIKKAVAEFGRI